MKLEEINMANNDVNYQALTNEQTNPFAEKSSQQHKNQQQHHETIGIDDMATDTETEDGNRDADIMIHVVPDTSKARWNHIEDLDSFFTRMYNYHQKHGFNVMMVNYVMDLVIFAFVVYFVTVVFFCIDYTVLDGNHTRFTLDEVILPYDACVSAIHPTWWLIIFLSTIFWLFRLIRFCYHAVQFYDIKKFFNSALKIDDDELGNYTWHEVQRRIREVQVEQQMCIHKDQLTELDIYHRILRYKNYMVALMNKNLIQSTVNIPFAGKTNFFSKSLRFNLELIFFRSPWSVFDNWHLKEQYKRSTNRIELSHQLSKNILYAGLINLALAPVIFLFAVIFCVFSYGDLVKRDPGVLGIRCWSQYGMLYMRHFNELDHELQARLNRAYRPAVKYMESFSSPMGAVMARKLSFLFGGVSTVILMFFMFVDEDVAHIEHILQIVSIFTLLAIVSRVLIPDENMIFCPEQLMTAVLAHTHYLPIAWKGLAHTCNVRSEFGQFFQLRVFYLLSELLSPITTPFILIFYIRPKALDYIDFFRNFTVSVVGVGDVCSFAQMDVRKHGNPEWQPTHSTIGDLTETMETPICETNKYTQGEHGKTELSLVHFTLTNPQWKMPTDAHHFVNGLKKHAQQDFSRARQTGAMNTAMGQSLFSVGNLGGEYSSIVDSLIMSPRYGAGNMGFSQMATGFRQPSMMHTGDGDMPSQTYDFNRMLQQPLSEGVSSTAYRSTLHNIQEMEADDTSAGENNETPGASPMHVRRMPSVMSVTTGATHREGPGNTSHEHSLIQSLYGQGGIGASTAGILPTGHEPILADLTTADMCLSTLYLHELFHRQNRRRSGSRSTHQSSTQSHQWQLPHRDSSHAQATHIRPNPPHPENMEQAAEKTPLLNPKRT